MSVMCMELSVMVLIALVYGVLCFGVVACCVLGVRLVIERSATPTDVLFNPADSPFSDRATFAAPVSASHTGFSLMNV